MATFLKDKSSAFKQIGDHTELPTKQRSEARMKSYTSATDARAWVNNISENKQYIIDLMGIDTADLAKNQQQGKYVPVDVLVKTLMANKDADLKRQSRIIQDLEAFINELKLSPEELKKLNKMKASWGAGDAISKMKKSNIPISRSDSPKPHGRTASESRFKKPHESQESPRTSSESRLPTPRSESHHGPETSSSSGLLDSARSSGRQHPRSVEPGQRKRWSSPGVSDKTGIVTYADVTPLSGAVSGPVPGSIPRSRTSSGSSSNISKKALVIRPPVLLEMESSHKDIQVSPMIDDADSQTQSVRIQEIADKEQQVLCEVGKLRSRTSCTSVQSRIPVLVQTNDSKIGKEPTITQTSITKLKDTDTSCREDLQVSVGCSNCEFNKEMARKAVEQLNEFQEVLSAHDHLQEKFIASELELERLKEQLSEKDSCDGEIAAMAQEIEKLKSAGMKDELKIVSTELQLLKKYCRKLMYIKDENKKLKNDIENLQIQKRDSKESHLEEFHTSLVNISASASVDNGVSQSGDLKKQLQTKIAALKDVTKQRDKLQSSVSKLEQKLKKFDNLSNEIKTFKERSKVLDSVVEEKLALECRLEKVASMERDLLNLKQRADKADELQRALENAQNRLLQMHDAADLHAKQTTNANDGDDIEELKYKAREAEILQVERDRMRVRIDELTHCEQEFKVLQGKYRLLEVSRNERGNYKSKMIELSNIKDDYKSLREQTEQVKSLSAERDVLSRKICDLECVLADQENEISRLVLHIDRLSRGQDKQQDRAKQIVTDLRIAIDKKNSLIVNSEEQLANVQSQLKQTIDTLASETIGLKQQVLQADIFCHDLKCKLERTSKQLSEANAALSEERNMCLCYEQQIDSLRKDNGRLQEMADRINELTDSGKMESILRKSHDAVCKAAERLSTYSAGNGSNRPSINSAGTNTHESSVRGGTVLEYEEQELPERAKITVATSGPSVVGAILPDLIDRICTCRNVCTCTSSRSINRSSIRAADVDYKEHELSTGATTQQESSVRGGSTVVDYEEYPELPKITVPTSGPSIVGAIIPDLIGRICVCRSVCTCTSSSINADVEHKEHEISTVLLDLDEQVSELPDAAGQTDDLPVEPKESSLVGSTSLREPMDAKVSSKGGTLVRKGGSVLKSGSGVADQVDDASTVEAKLRPEGSVVTSASGTKHTSIRDSRSALSYQAGALPVEAIIRPKGSAGGIKHSLVRGSASAAGDRSGDVSSVNVKIRPKGSLVTSAGPKQFASDRRSDEIETETRNVSLAVTDASDIGVDTNIPTSDYYDTQATYGNVRAYYTSQGPSPFPASDTFASGIVSEISQARSPPNARSIPASGVPSQVSKVIPERSAQSVEVPICRQMGTQKICTDSIQTQVEMLAREGRGEITLDNVTCICREIQNSICDCTTTATSPPPTDESAQTVNVTPYRQMSTQKICVDSAQTQIDMVDEERRGEINLDSITCICRGVLRTICDGIGTGTRPDEAHVARSHGPDSTSSGVESIDRSQSKGSEGFTYSQLKEELARKEKELKEIKRQRDTVVMENQALRKHANELKDIAKHQITGLTSELRRSREEAALVGKTDDSKTVLELREHNKVLTKEVERLRQLECDCELLRAQKDERDSQQLETNELRERNKVLTREVERLRQFECDCELLKAEKEKKVSEGAEGKASLAISAPGAMQQPSGSDRSIPGTQHMSEVYPSRKDEFKRSETHPRREEHEYAEGILKSYIEDAMVPISERGLMASHAAYSEKGGHVPKESSMDARGAYPEKGRYAPKESPMESGAGYPEKGGFAPKESPMETRAGYSEKEGYAPKEGPMESRAAYLEKGGYAPKESPIESRAAYSGKGGYIPKESSMESRGAYPPEKGGYAPKDSSAAHSEKEGYVPKESQMESRGGYPEKGGYVPKEGPMESHVAHPEKGGYAPKEGLMESHAAYPETGVHVPKEIPVETRAEYPQHAFTEPPALQIPTDRRVEPIVEDTVRVTNFDQPERLPFKKSEVDSSLMRELQELKKQNESLRADGDNADALLELRKKLAECKEKNNELEKQLDKSGDSEDLERLVRQLKECKDKLAEAGIALPATVEASIPPPTEQKKRAESMGNLMHELDNLRKQLADCRAQAEQEKHVLPSAGDKKDDDKLAKEIEDLRKQLEKCKSKLDEVDKHPGDKQTPPSSGDKNERENEELKKELEMLKKQFAESGKEPGKKDDDKLAKENDDLRKQLERAAKELEQIKSKEPPVRDEKFEPDPYKKQNETLGKQLEQCTQELDDLRKQLEKCRIDLGAQEKIVASAAPTAMGDTSNLQKLNDDLQKQLEDLKKQLAISKDDLEKERKAPKTDDTAKDVDDLKKELEALRKQLEVANERLAECQQHLEEEQKKLADEKSKKPATAGVGDNKEELDDLRRQLADSRKQLEDEKKKSPFTATTTPVPTGNQKELDDLKKQLEDARSKLEEKEKPVTARGAAAPVLDAKQKELDDLRKQLEDSKKQLEEEKKKPTPAAGAGAPLPAGTQKELDDLKKQLEDARKQLDEEKKITPDGRNQKELDDLRKQLEDSKRQLEEKKPASALAAAAASPAGTQKELDNLKKQLEDARKQLDEEKKLTPDGRNQKELDDLRKQLEDERKKPSPAAGPLPAGNQKEFDDLKKQLEDARKQIDEEKKKLPDGGNQKELDDLRKQLEDCRKQLEEEKKKPPAAAATAPVVIQKELDDLRKQLEDSKKQLEEEKKKPPLAAAGAAAAPTGNQKELDDLRKQLEDSKKQLEEEKKKPPLAAAGAAAAPTGNQKELDDLRKQLEDSKKQLEEEKKKPPLATAAEGAPTGNQKELDDLKKQLEDSKKQLEEEKKKAPLAAAAAGAPTGNQKELDDLRKQLEDCRKQLEDEKKKLLPTAGGHLPSTASAGNQKEWDDLRKQLENSTKQLEEEKKKSQAAAAAAPPPQALAGNQKELNDLRKQLEDSRKQLEEERKKPSPTAATPAGTQKELDNLRKQLEDSRKELEGKKQLEEDRRKSGLPAAAAAPVGADGNKKELEDLRKQLADCRKELEDERKKKPTAAGAIVGAPVAAGAAPPTGTVLGNQNELDDLKKQLEDGKASGKATGPAVAGGVPESGASPTIPTALPTGATGPQVGGTATDSTGRQVRSILGDPTQALITEVDDCWEKLAELQKQFDGLIKENMQLKGIKDTGDPDKNKMLAMHKYSDSDYEDLLRQLEGEKLRNKQIEDALAQGDNAVIFEDYRNRLAELEAKLQDCESKRKVFEERSSKELAKTKKQSINAIKATRSSYERDISKLQEKYVEGIERLQTSHEEIISQEHKELETEIDSLRKESAKKQETIEELKCLCYVQKKQPALCHVQIQSLDIVDMECVCEDMMFAYLLRKILYCGLETLTFEDLQHMHTKICEATAKVMGNVKQSDSEFDMGPCSCNYKRRQQIAQTQVAKLQMEVAIERQRLENLKKALDIERSTQEVMTQHFQRQAKIALMPKVQVLRTYIPETATLEGCRCASAVDITNKNKGF